MTFVCLLSGVTYFLIIITLYTHVFKFLKQNTTILPFINICYCECVQYYDCVGEWKVAGKKVVVLREKEILSTGRGILDQ